MKAPKITDTEREWMDKVNNDRPCMEGMREILEEFFEKHFTVVPDGVSGDRFIRETKRLRSLFKRECSELIDEILYIQKVDDGVTVNMYWDGSKLNHK